MKPSSRARGFLLAIFVLGACKGSGTTASIDSAMVADGALDTAAQAADVAIGKGGAGGTTVIGQGGSIDSGGPGTGGAADAQTTGTRASGGTLGSGGVWTGGSPGTGGVGTGGAMMGSGGRVGTGGTSAGGVSGQGGLATGGGTVGTGGVGTGGTVGTGGVGTGGTVATGGVGTGGTVGTGGVGTGGTVATGGTVGSGGTSTGGVTGTGGSTPQVCPDSSQYVGNASWPDQLVVTAGAKYCGTFKQIRNLEQELAAKAKLTIAAGTYPLANTAGTYDFALPVCFERPPGAAIPSFAGAGKVRTIPQTSSVDTYRSCGHIATQPISVAGSSDWMFSMRLSYWTWSGVPQPPQLDGSILDLPTPSQAKTPGHLDDLELCNGTECDDQAEDLKFEACDPDYPLQRHTITFDGGQVVFDVRITGEVGVAVMTAAFTAASGTLGGTAFAQTDYWKLVYSADHHHFIRNFAVLFAAPIGDVCGLKVLNFWGNRDNAPLPDVYTIHCDLSNIAARSVTQALLELP